MNTTETERERAARLLPDGMRCHVAAHLMASRLKETEAEYRWVEFNHPTKGRGFALLPDWEDNPHSLRRIASIERDGNGRYAAAYRWPHSTGNKSGSWAILKTPASAKQWVEAQLAKFWEPPHIAA